jgi:DNA gyrase subunit A
MGRTWRSSVVEEMLKRTLADAARPEGLPAEFGFSTATGGYRLSDAQAAGDPGNAPQRLTGPRAGKIADEYRQVMELIVDLLDILAAVPRHHEIIRTELQAMRDQNVANGDKRRRRSSRRASTCRSEGPDHAAGHGVTLSHSGYMKAQPLDEYRAQKRGGRGKQATNIKEEDFIEKLFIAEYARLHPLLLESRATVLAEGLRVPQGQRVSRGKPIVNLLPLVRSREDHGDPAGPASSPKGSTCSWRRRWARSRRRRSRISRARGRRGSSPST